MTTAHQAFDERIFNKEAMSLSEAGYQISLIAQDCADIHEDPIHFISLSKSKGRLHRMIGLTFKSYILALKERADIYHFHDPELLPVGVLLKMAGKKVVYDAHEDYGQKILSKRWIKKRIRKPLSFFTDRFEKICSHFFDFIITADTLTKLKFPMEKSEVIANYPPLSFLEGRPDRGQNGKGLKLIYVGGISRDRGAQVMIQAASLMAPKKIELQLLGKIEDAEFSGLFKTSGNIRYIGCRPWEEVKGHLYKADIGLVLLQPVPAYLYCPGENIIKMFEYMGTGLPLIISNFPRLKQFVDENKCGLAVDPTKPEEVAVAVEALCADPDLRRQMGENGRSAVLKKYNWEREAQKLLDIYSRVTA